MNLAVVSAVNRPGKRDATGAFLPEARAWTDHHQGSALFLDGESLADGQMRDRVMDQLFRPEHAGLTQLAFFCHGFRSGIQFGFHGRQGAECLAAAVQGATERATVVLFCCSAGQWFGPELARALGPQYAVWSHLTRGHTTRNPRLIFSRGDATEDVWQGLTWSRRRRLRALLRTDLRLRLGVLSPRSLREILDREHAGIPG